jgi:hypothetical protein
LESPLFQFSGEEQLLSSLGTSLSEFEKSQISYLVNKGLPPVISMETLAVMLGVNPGIIWSFANRTHRYYRTFEIPKGRGIRQIQAPKVGLKLIQTWISYHISRRFSAHSHVYGFVPGRSHIQAAQIHVGAEWAFSVDVKNFFSTTPTSLVNEAYHSLGYDLAPAELLTKLSCYRGCLPQGAPTSPPLSNICFVKLDARLLELAAHHDAKLTRYADDIVFSGGGAFPAPLREQVHNLFASSPWQLAPEKESLEPIKGRIKVHGLLVSGDQLRLTKGYRNRIRAYRHILETRGANTSELSRLRGHLEFANHIERISKEPTTPENESF